MLENEIYRMLPKTKELLENDIQRRKMELADISMQSAGLWEGDQWHSTGFREQQRRRELAIRLLQMIERKGGKIAVLPKPTQNVRIEVGHMVRIKLLDDPDITEAGIAFSLVHILTSEDVLYLGFIFDNLNEMIVSKESPLGSALLGRKRGEEANYLPGNRFRITNDEDAIKPTYLFDK